MNDRKFESVKSKMMFRLRRLDGKAREKDRRQADLDVSIGHQSVDPLDDISFETEMMSAEEFFSD